MMPVEKAIEAAKTLVRPLHPGQPCISGPKREQMYTHEFVGANAVVTELLGAKQHAAIAVKRLQNAASISLELPATAAAGTMVTFKVKVRNETAGHNLPTSLTDVRQVWVEVVAHAGGKEVFHSGGLDNAGASTRKRRCSTRRLSTRTDTTRRSHGRSFVSSRTPRYRRRARRRPRTASCSPGRERAAPG